MNQKSFGEWGGEVRTDDLATLVARGRQLHSNAVLDACARLLQPLKGLGAGNRTERIATSQCRVGSR